jgi:DHA2 family multidrug resistance protein-like MFS transporter
VLLGLVGTSGLAMLVLGSVVFSVGLTPVVALTTDLVVSSAPPERAGSASSLSETSSELGGALGIAVLGTIAAAVYRAAMVNAIPGGAPQGVGDAARGTIGGAMAMAAQLPEAAGAALLGAARAAYVQGMQVSTSLSAAIMLGTAVLAFVLLRTRTGKH